MKCALGDLALHRRFFLTGWALFQWRIAETLHFFKFMPATLTHIFVNWHLAFVSNGLKEIPQPLEMDFLLCDNNIFASTLSKLVLVVNARKRRGFHLN